jgi:hypothetical protein
MQLILDYLIAEILSYFTIFNIPVTVILAVFSGKGLDNILSAIYLMPPFTLINFGKWWSVPLEGMMLLGW